MATTRANLDVTQYVKVASSGVSVLLQSHRDTVRVVFSDVKPAKSNTTFHELGGEHEPLDVPYTDSDVWVLATTDRCALTITTQPILPVELTDKSSRSAMVSMTGELHVAGKVDEVNINFQYGIRTANTKQRTTGTGSVGTDKSTATLSPGTGVGLAELVSLSPVRYRAGHESHCAMSWVFADPETDLDQYAGYINADDKFAVGYQGLNFGLWLVEGGNVSFVQQSDFNLDKLDGTGPSKYTINPQAGNLYRLTFTWHGFLPLMLEVSTGLDWYPVHIFNFVNTATETHLENPHLPIGGLVERTTGTGADTPMKTGSWRGGSMAFTDDDDQSDYWTQHTVLEAALVSNDRTNIFTIRNQATYAGKTNHIVYELGVIAFESDANKTVAVYGTQNATLTGNGPFTDIDAVNSPLQYSEGGTVSDGIRGTATVIKSGGDRRTDVRGTGLYIYPGQEVTFEVDPGGAVNGTFSISARFIGRH